MHKLCLRIGEYLSVITYSDPTQKCPMLDSYIGGMQGPRGYVRYMYMGCATDGEILAWLKLNTLEQFKFDMKINLVNIIRVIQQETSLR